MPSPPVPVGRRLSARVTGRTGVYWIVDAETDEPHLRRHHLLGSQFDHPEQMEIGARVALEYRPLRSRGLWHAAPP